MFTSLRTLTDHLTAHMLFGRGDNHRDCNLCDFGYIEGNYKSPKPYLGVLFVEREGKANKVNHHVKGYFSASEFLFLTLYMFIHYVFSDSMSVFISMRLYAIRM